MATKKDLVEAYSFSRRRLVTAFTSGAPGGREVEPAKPMRAVGGGAALCVLLLAGAAVAGFFSPRTPDGWLDDGSLVASSAGGKLYYVENPDGESPVLRPFTNATSALLFVGSDAFADPMTAPPEEINDQAKGPELGINDVPSDIPPPDRLLDTAWAACTSTGTGVRTLLADSPGAVPVANAAAVVRAEAGLYLVTAADTDEDDPAAVAFTLPEPSAADIILDDLRVGRSSTAIEVDNAWLALFKAYDQPLGQGAFRLGGSGPVGYADQLSYLRPGTRSPRIGDVVSFEGDSYLLTADGAARFSPFALAVWRSATRRPADPLSSPPGRFAPSEPWPEVWPELTTYQGIDGGDDVCAVLQPRPEDTPTVLLGRDVTEEARPEGVPEGRTEEQVQSGYGALFQTGGFDSATGDLTFLVDDRGVAYPIDEPATTLANLGYAEVPRAVVPDTWLELFRTGSRLSAALAGRTPREGGS